MGSTVKITESKNISFKKLGLLYLVFILFLFLTTPGQFVKHYDQLHTTQKELNDRWLLKLKTFVPKTAEESLLKETALRSVAAIDSLQGEYIEFVAEDGVFGDKLRENRFAEKKMRGEDLEVSFTNANNEFGAVFEKVTGKSLKKDLYEFKGFDGRKYGVVDYFFKETPNGAIPAVFEHFKTTYLINTLSELFKGEEIFPQYKNVSLEESDFIETFKQLLVLGSTFECSIKPTDNTTNIEVRINGNLVNSSKNQDGTYKVSYKPKALGKYLVEVLMGEQRVFAGFKVIKPEFRFIMEKSSFDGIVGEEMVISLDTQLFSGNNIKFISDKAEVRRVGEKLFVTPKEKGLFHLTMRNKVQVLDDIKLYAHDPERINVDLLDISGRATNFSNANKLESLNTFWQVQSFRMTIIDSLGIKKVKRSATRFLRNDLRELEHKASSGGILLFDDIKLVGKNGEIIKSGRPIVFRK
jgi:hypothetical protein